MLSALLCSRLHDLAEPGRRAHFEECLKGDFVEADCIGSPYAITRYVPAKELGSDDDLAAFRKRLADRLGGHIATLPSNKDST